LSGNYLVETSRYFAQIQSFLEYYDRSQILLFTLDELQNDPAKVCRTIFEKVGVEPDFGHPGFQRRHHRTSYTYPRTGLAAKMALYRGTRALRPALPFMFKKMDRPHLDGELRDRLVAALKPDTDSLREYWGRDLRHWSV
jgi:hypothetical protein